MFSMLLSKLFGLVNTGIVSLQYRVPPLTKIPDSESTPERNLLKTVRINLLINENEENYHSLR